MIETDYLEPLDYYGRGIKYSLSIKMLRKLPPGATVIGKPELIRHMDGNQYWGIKAVWSDQFGMNQTAYFEIYMGEYLGHCA